MTDMRVFKGAPGVTLSGNFPSLTYSAEETALRALGLTLFFDPSSRYIKGNLDSDEVSAFRWRAAVGGIKFKPFGVNRPLLITDGDRQCLRFNFGGLGTGTNGEGGSLIQDGSDNILPNAVDYTFGFLYRIPVPNTEGTASATGGILFGNRLDATQFIASASSSTGRWDYRHAGTAQSASNTVDQRDGLWHYAVFYYDAANDIFNGRRDGSTFGGSGPWTNLSYAQNISTSDGGLRMMISGVGNAAVSGAAPFDLGPWFLINGLYALSDAGKVTTINNYLNAEKTKLSA